MQKEIQYSPKVFINILFADNLNLGRLYQV